MSLSVIPITIMDSVVRQFERTGGKYGRRKRRNAIKNDIKFITKALQKHYKNITVSIDICLKM